MSDEEDQQRQAARFLAPEGEDAETWALQSVAGVLQRVQEAPGDEVGVEALVRQLERLPRKARAHQLVRLLLETREESIPKEAVLGIWGKLVAGDKSKGGPTGAQKSRAKSAASIPIIRSRLLESKRKQAECDLKLLQNRISLLQHEESKAWKKIAQTKDRAQEILEMRLASMQRQEEKSMHAVERERQSRSAQKKQHSLKKESVIKKKHAAIQVISKKYQDVEQVKTESKRLKAERERLQLLQVERARAKRQAIRRQEDALKKKKLLDRQQVDEEAALRLMKKAIAEERQIREHRKKVQEMEEAERALIQRLQGTQLIQREAYSVLEQALLRTDLKRAHSVAPLGER
ncbi:Zz type zinc finger domain containing protein [Phytophthora cinnamomi]|uniref:Zz type zinc finger domain containing protein n=1 Tax=Phytophthora cinnamomi TaxID=4785 RepID=UPI003559E345|nr:Zz type zinc finger domain containing protein [Phytophthora cinnamomi]